MITDILVKKQHHDTLSEDEASLLEMKSELYSLSLRIQRIIKDIKVRENSMSLFPVDSYYFDEIVKDMENMQVELVNLLDEYNDIREKFIEKIPSCRRIVVDSQEYQSPIDMVYKYTQELITDTPKDK